MGSEVRPLPVTPSPASAAKGFAVAASRRRPFPLARGRGMKGGAFSPGLPPAHGGSKETLGYNLSRLAHTCGSFACVRFIGFESSRQPAAKSRRPPDRIGTGSGLRYTSPGHGSASSIAHIPHNGRYAPPTDCRRRGNRRFAQNLLEETSWVTASEFPLASAIS